MYYCPPAIEENRAAASAWHTEIPAIHSRHVAVNAGPAPAFQPLQLPFQYSVFASAVILVGCGSGGGSSATSSAMVRSSVSYYTPSSVGHFIPMTGSGINAPVADVYTKDLNNDAVEEVVVTKSMVVLFSAIFIVLPMKVKS